MATTIKLRRDTASNWTGNNPVLSLGEPGVEIDTLKMKIGNGSTAWNSLDYLVTPIPVATGTRVGGVKVDGSSIVINNGVISTNINYTLPTATTTVLGGVKVDGITITINDGVITAVGGGGGGTGSGTVNYGTVGSLAYYPTNGTIVDNTPGITWDSNDSILTISGTINANTVNANTITGTVNVSNLSGIVPNTQLPIATITSLGIVRVDGVTTTINNGIISASQYQLPTATTSVLGGVRVDGTTITINNGVISSLQYSLPTATTSVLGGVKVDGTTITINNGIITATAAGGTGGGGTVNSGLAGSLAYYPSSGTVVDDISGITWNSATTTLTVSGILNASTITGSINTSNLTGTISSTLLPVATTTALGGVKVDGTTIIISNGVISASLSSYTGSSSLTTIGKISGTIGYDFTQNNSNVTQITSKGTAVTCNGRTGQITTHNSALNASTAITFRVNNTFVSVNDVVIVNIRSGATPSSYQLSVTEIGLEYFDITLYNASAVLISEAIDINFAIIKVS